jgi:hypothetical protein
MTKDWNTIKRFLTENPDHIAKRGKTFPTMEQLQVLYIRGQSPVLPKSPTTVPDVMVDIVLQEYFNVPDTSVEDAVRLHSLSMAAENVVGDLLERYLAKEMEPFGWIWCAGSVVRSIDFIRDSNGVWDLLQVKNRDNSENSSSSAIRNGTSIKKWFRTFSRTGKTNWDHFPDYNAALVLSEQAFHTFAIAHLKSIKRQSSL